MSMSLTAVAFSVSMPIRSKRRETRGGLGGAAKYGRATHLAAVVADSAVGVWRVDVEPRVRIYEVDANERSLQRH